MGRRNPYTANGVRRVICQCCNKQKAEFQWTACALKRYVPVCVDCDKHLNMVLLAALGVDNAHVLLKRYDRTVEALRQSTR